MTRARWLVAVLIALVGTGCPPRQDARAKAGAVFLILIDRSESVNKPEMRKLYVQSLTTILHSLGHGDVLLVGWITDQSATELQLPMNATFPRFCPQNDNPLVLGPERAKSDSVLDALRTKISDSLEHLLLSQHRTITHTAILQSMELAQRVFASYEGNPNVLIIMSDMVEDSEKRNFLNEHLTSARTDAIINGLRSEGRLPDLRGVRVQVLGAATGNGLRDRQVRDFWFSLFKATGAALRPADYGAALIKFDLPHAPPTCS